MFKTKYTSFLFFVVSVVFFLILFTGREIFISKLLGIYFPGAFAKVVTSKERNQNDLFLYWTELDVFPTVLLEV